MKLTAVCVTYDRPHLLGELIQCFLYQDYPKALRELIILDDAGQYGNQEGDGWRIISIPRRFNSLGEKRNACIALASPDAEGFLVADDDDIYLPHWFSACARALKEGDFCRPSLVLSFKDNKLKAMPSQNVYHPSWAFRKDAFYKIGGYKNLNSGEDQEFGGRLIAAKFKEVDPCKYYPPYLVYRWDGTNSYHMSASDYVKLGQRTIKKCEKIDIRWSRPWNTFPIELPGGQLLNQPPSPNVKADIQHQTPHTSGDKPPMVHTSGTGKRVNLIGNLKSPFNAGPGIGMFALQKLLKDRIKKGLDWLQITDQPISKAVLPWFWWLGDRQKIVRWADETGPFVVGPNVFFINSRRPRIDKLESSILDAATCRMIFCHSEWYKNLVIANRGPLNNAEIVLWPYPVDPWPDGPKDPTYDLLVYVKNYVPEGLTELLVKLFPKSVIIRYGSYKREELFHVAARSRACAYLSQDESGGIATAEILLSGCPIVGVTRGAPFITDGVTGIFVPAIPQAKSSLPEFKIYVDALRAAMEFDRSVVREYAEAQFDNNKILETVVNALDRARSL